MRRDLEAGGAHGFGETGRFALDDGAGRFGGHVARGEAGAAGGEDDVHLAAVRPLAEGLADGRFVVGEDRFLDDGPVFGGDKTRQRGPGRIFAFAARGSVGESQNPKSNAPPCRGCRGGHASSFPYGRT